MGRALIQQNLHIVFSTKNRIPFLTGEKEYDMHCYLGGICNRLESPPIEVGGYENHVHVLCRLSKNIKLSDFMKLLKGNSSKWFNDKGDGSRSFAWQESYAAFSVSEHDIDRCIKYIQNQKEHHQKKSFQDEYWELLREFNIEFDERYMWD